MHTQVTQIQVTALDVINETLRFFKKPKSFATNVYFSGHDGAPYDGVPGPSVIQACAVGGIEQSIWRLTGQNVTKERPSWKTTSPRRKTVYHQTIKLLNAKTRELYPDSDGQKVQSLEQLTFSLSSDLAIKQRVLKVMRAVKADLEATSG